MQEFRPTPANAEAIAALDGERRQAWRYGELLIGGVEAEYLAAKTEQETAESIPEDTRLTFGKLFHKQAEVADYPERATEAYQELGTQLLSTTREGAFADDLKATKRGKVKGITPGSLAAEQARREQEQDALAQAAAAERQARPTAEPGFIQAEQAAEAVSDARLDQDAAAIRNSQQETALLVENQRHSADTATLLDQIGWRQSALGKLAGRLDANVDNRDAFDGGRDVFGNGERTAIAQAVLPSFENSPDQLVVQKYLAQLEQELAFGQALQGGVRGRLLKLRGTESPLVALCDGDASKAAALRAEIISALQQGAIDGTVPANFRELMHQVGQRLAEINGRQGMTMPSQAETEAPASPETSVEAPENTATAAPQMPRLDLEEHDSLQVQQAKLQGYVEDMKRYYAQGKGISDVDRARLEKRIGRYSKRLSEVTAKLAEHDPAGSQSEYSQSEASFDYGIPDHERFNYQDTAVSQRKRLERLGNVIAFLNERIDTDTSLSNAEVQRLVLHAMALEDLRRKMQLKTGPGRGGNKKRNEQRGRGQQAPPRQTAA